MPVEITAKGILNRSKRRDPWFLDDYTVNPYSGCSFNCLYCYVRGSKYGINMAEKLSVKVNAPELLDKQLAIRARKGEYGFIVMSSATDPYLQFEKEYQLTRQMLEVVLKHRFPVHIITKSDLIIRDLDVLRRIDEQAILPDDLQKAVGRGAIITFSFCTLDDLIASRFEPGATAPTARLLAMESILQQEFLSGVSLMPLLPYITDKGQMLEQVFSTFSRLGAKYLMPATLTLFGNGNSDSKTLVLRAVQKNYPQLLSKYQQFFEHSHSMPSYYIKAFTTKMEELSRQYKIPDLITRARK